MVGPARSRAGWLLPVGILVAALAGFPVAVSVATHGVGCVPVLCATVHRPGPMVAGPVRWLPLRLVPDPGAPPLPTDHGVGPGSLAYTDVAGHAVLVTQDLTQYSLPTRKVGYGHVTVPTVPLTLSPDGRWLVTTEANSTVLRDLTSGRRLDLGFASDGVVDLAWGPDRFVVAGLTADTENATSWVQVVDLTSLQSQRIGIRGRLCGILDSGDLVACPWAQAPVAMALSIVDSGKGTVRQTVPVAMTGFLTSVERYGEGQIHELETVMVSGGTVAIRLHPYSDQGGIPVPGDVLLVDVRTGVVTGKVSLPVQVPRWVPHGGGMLFMASEGRRLQASQPEGIVLVHVMPRDDPTDHFAVSVVAVEVVNPGTGYRSEVMTVDPGVTKLVVRGAVR